MTKETNPDPWLSIFLSLYIMPQFFSKHLSFQTMYMPFNCIKRKLSIKFSLFSLTLYIKYNKQLFSLSFEYHIFYPSSIFITFKTHYNQACTHNEIYLTVATSSMKWRWAKWRLPLPFIRCLYRLSAWQNGVICTCFPVLGQLNQVCKLEEHPCSKLFNF